MYSCGTCYNPGASLWSKPVVNHTTFHRTENGGEEGGAPQHFPTGSATIRQIFLFEQSVIVSRVIKHPVDGDVKGFVFLKQIKTNRMSLIPAMPKVSMERQRSTKSQSGEKDEEASVAAIDADSTAAAIEATSEAPLPVWKLDNALAIWNAEDSSTTTFHVLVLETPEMKAEWCDAIRGILRMQQNLVSMLQNPQRASFKGGDDGGRGGGGGSLFFTPSASENFRKNARRRASESNTTNKS